MIKRYFADGRHFVTLEAGGFHDKANNSGYENYGWQSALGVEMTVYGPFSVYGLAQYRWLKYRDELYPDLQKKPRQDDQYQWLAGALMDFPQGWGMDLNYRYVKNDSNFGLYEYDRNVFTLTTYLRF
jgi:opacity protein-like surface antigen